tara:strand:+ start:554 stop:790 length:237 start_codon:yes stop_codon:yes gene_type:complete
MLLIKIRKVKTMSNTEAKLQAYNDMLKEEALERKHKSNKLKEFNRDAINQAELYRFIFGNEFVNTNNEIVKYNNERLS